MIFVHDDCKQLVYLTNLNKYTSATHEKEQPINNMNEAFTLTTLQCKRANQYVHFGEVKCSSSQKND